MTKAVGHGTSNLAFNFIDEYLGIIRREAFKRGQSMKDYYDRRFIRGVALENPGLAKKLAKIKRDRIKATSLKATAMLALVLGYMIAGGDAMRRPSGSLRGGRRNEIEARA